MSGASVTAMLAFAAATGLLVGAQFLPWQEIEASGGFGGFTFTADSEARTWEAAFSGSGGGNSGSDSVGWYDSDMDDEEGVDLIRVGIPFLVVGLVGAFLGLLITVARSARDGFLVGAIATICAIVGTALIAIGADQFFDGDGSAGMALFLAIGAIVALAVGTVAGLAPGARATSRSIRA